MKLAQRLECFPPAFVGEPFSHLNRMLELVADSHTLGQTAEFGVTARDWITEAIDPYEKGEKSTHSGAGRRAAPYPALSRGGPWPEFLAGHSLDWGRPIASEEQDFKHIHDHIDQFTVSPSTVLYHTEDHGDYIFTVRCETFELIQYLPSGRQCSVQLARTINVIGFEALVEDLYVHDVIAIHHTEVCRYLARVVCILGRENPKPCHKLMARWQRAFSGADT